MGRTLATTLLVAISFPAALARALPTAVATLATSTTFAAALAALAAYTAVVAAAWARLRCASRAIFSAS